MSTEQTRLNQKEKSNINCPRYHHGSDHKMMMFTVDGMNTSVINTLRCAASDGYTIISTTDGKEKVCRYACTVPPPQTRVWRSLMEASINDQTSRKAITSNVWDAAAGACDTLTIFTQFTEFLMKTRGPSSTEAFRFCHHKRDDLPFRGTFHLCFTVHNTIILHWSINTVFDVY